MLLAFLLGPTKALLRLRVREAGPSLRFLVAVLKVVFLREMLHAATEGVASLAQLKDTRLLLLYDHRFVWVAGTSGREKLL